MYTTETPLTDGERTILRMIEKHPELVEQPDWDSLSVVMDLPLNSLVSARRHKLISKYRELLYAQGLMWTMQDTPSEVQITITQKKLDYYIGGKHVMDVVTCENLDKLFEEYLKWMQ